MSDFANQLAKGNPDYICYSWCDSVIPMGHEMEHREIAAVYRSIPLGAYRETDRKNGVFARLAEKKDAFYVVNTGGKTVKSEMKTGVSGRWRDAVSGEKLSCANNAATFQLKEFECKVFLPDTRK
jgi:hypothetical protein